MNKAMIAAMLLAGNLMLTGCEAQQVPTEPTTQTQKATLHIEVVGEKEMDFLPGAALEGAPAIENKGTIDAYCFLAGLSSGQGLSSRNPGSRRLL